MHPKTTDYVRTFLARYTMTHLICIYLFLNALIAFVLSIFYALFSNVGEFSLMQWFLYSILQLFDAELTSVKVDTDSLQILPLIVGNVIKTLFPAIFLGSVLFKLFQEPKVLVFRKKCSLFFDDKRNSMMLAIRLYSSTKLQIVDVNIRSFARIFRFRTDTQEPYLQNVVLQKDFKGHEHWVWPISLTHVPFTIFIPLCESDIVDNVNIKTIHSIQGHKINEKFYVLLLVTGKIPDLGIEFIEDYWYEIPRDIEWGKFNDIHVSYDPNSESKKWIGWDNFERNQTVSCVKVDTDHEQAK